MTAQRQERNGSGAGAGFRPGIALIGLLAGLGTFAALAGFPTAAGAQTTERVIVNRYTGLAIEGYDPVAYFADARAELGRPNFEASQAGAVWRFRNESNRASFVAHPEIYGPQFGGYDPIDLARGVTYAGNPRFWLIVKQRLYLFGREQNRDAFAADPARQLRAAEARWPALEQGLAR
ncbi:YHS domain-containing (seleno)protein [Bradyrhizobium sp.]|uniref:YHS domain-containing (seleno)protein n=1 Tax=Bradyrhizobium sp. TaxID=376 RepID=UPI0027329933|nr:YHS domain-containing (seleno)protein [Bradyrhizobium sp.]MDP3075824.1 YHS domain-containing (seleno)protein [Bradyrhizobium sp.]